MKCKHSAEKCGIIAAVCYKEKQRISRDKTHETDHTTQEDKTMAKIYVFLADGCEEIEALTRWICCAEPEKTYAPFLLWEEKK